jgi:hypothetical protein
MDGDRITNRGVDTGCNDWGSLMLTDNDIREQMNIIAPESDFNGRSAQLTEAWEAAGVGPEAVEPVLKFMEDHPGIDYGMPGHLVHFIEKFHEKDYDEKLVESLRRKPTDHTTWMLNRVINGTKLQESRERLVGIMEETAMHPKADETTRERAKGFLDRLRRIG